ncbi:MAG: hypothetical protein HYU51_05020 [Candidatus Rokubacteria bacterium]|nr:hypothetical protein [Candidatus Rokubacteria bacterium]
MSSAYFGIEETSRYPRWRDAWQRRRWLHCALGEYEQAEAAEQVIAALRRDDDYRGDSRDMLGVLWGRDR